MSEAARQDDPIAHTSALGGLLAGLAVGAAVAVAGVAIAGTGGLAAVALVGAAASGGALIGEVLGSLSVFTQNTGQIITGSPDVYTNGRPAARSSLSTVLCRQHGPHLLAEGSHRVYINGMPASRVGDHSTCGGKISAGSANVWIGGESEKTEEIDDEVPGWLRAAIIGVGLGCGAALVGLGVIGPGMFAAGLAGGIGGGAGGHWLGGKLFGEGSDGQKLTMLAGALIGGRVGMRGGRGLDARYPTNAAAKQYRRDYLNNKYDRSGDLNKDINYRANQKAAYDYFKSKGFSGKDIDGYMKGIDFKKPVYVENINSGKALWQYQVPDGKQGRWYYFAKNVTPTELGINPKGTLKTGAEALKVPKNYMTIKQGEFLRSTSSPVQDTWSVSGKPFLTKGGAQQLFTVDNKAFPDP